MNVDILLAIYNGEKYLKSQLDSLLNQTYQNFKVIVKDDGSTDSSIDIILEYNRRYPKKFFFIKDKEKGLGPKGNFLELLKYSKSPYVMFCDQDDLWLENKIEITLKKMYENESNKPCLVHTDLKVVDEELNVISESFWNYQNINPEKKSTNRLIVQNNVTGCTVMINSKLKELVVGKKFENSLMHDWILAIIASHFGSVNYIKEQTILYRQHGTNNIGAQKYGIVMFLEKIKNTDFKDNVRNTQRQCRDLIKFFKFFKEVEIYAELDKLKWFNRKVHCLKYGFLKDGIIRNLVYLILV